VIFRQDNTDAAITLAALFASAEGEAVIFPRHDEHTEQAKQSERAALAGNPFAALATDDIEDNASEEGGVKLPTDPTDDADDDDDDDELPSL
jgi:hypothetical protein